MIRSVVIIICGLAMTVFAGECALAKPAAGGPPQLDIKATCKRAQPVSGETSAFDSCMNDEKGAQAELAKSWSTFKAGPRAICVQETKIGGAPSYVELITCLQLDQQAGDASKENSKKLSVPSGGAPAPAPAPAPQKP